MNSDHIIDMGQEGSLYINEQARAGLRTAANWALGLAIFGFIGVGLMFIIGIVMLAFSGAMAGQADMPIPFWLLSLVYLVIGGLYLMPLIYLYQFAAKMKRALLYNDTISLTDSCINLGKHYKFLGIMMIVLIGLYIILIVAMFGLGLAAGGL